MQDLGTEKPLKRTRAATHPLCTGTACSARAKDRCPVVQFPYGQPAYGQFLKTQIVYVLPDPGALNSCMHVFPENKKYWIYFGLTHNCKFWDMGFETLKL